MGNEGLEKISPPTWSLSIFLGAHSCGCQQERSPQEDNGVEHGTDQGRPWSGHYRTRDRLRECMQWCDCIAGRICNEPLSVEVAASAEIGAASGAGEAGARDALDTLACARRRTAFQAQLLLTLLLAPFQTHHDIGTAPLRLIFFDPAEQVFAFAFVAWPYSRHEPQQQPRQQ